MDAATGDREMPTYGTKETKLEMGVQESCLVHFSSGHLPDSKAGQVGVDKPVRKPLNSEQVSPVWRLRRKGSTYSDCQGKDPIGMLLGYCRNLISWLPCNHGSFQQEMTSCV